MADQGSPPRVRGKVRDQGPGRRALGITPACAGKREQRHSTEAGFRGYPRERGEKPGHLQPLLRLRITPAFAGKSVPGSVPGSRSRDHPHVCGEKCTGRRIDFSDTGSPPRVRGKGDFLCQPADTAGITPACAGKRRLPVSARRYRRDHPRVCGERHLMTTSSTSGKESPPRARGIINPTVLP